MKKNFVPLMVAMIILMLSGYTSLTKSQFNSPKVEETVAPKEGVAIAAPITAPVVTDKNLDPVNSKQDVRNFVTKWLTSWESGDMKTYRSCYASDFHSKGINLNGWISHKTNVQKISKNINILIDHLQISADANIAKAVFTQFYSSSISKDKCEKTLELRKINDEWKIYREIINK
jgi:ketosteroid isomerase-like protein